MTTTTEEKVRENRLRRAAKRQGYELVKSRVRDPRAIGFRGWMVVDAHTNGVVAGDLTYGGMTVEQVDAFLSEGIKPKRLRRPRKAGEGHRS